MEYDRTDSFPFDYDPNGIPFYFHNQKEKRVSCFGTHTKEGSPNWDAPFKEGWPNWDAPFTLIKLKGTFSGIHDTPLVLKAV